MLSIGRKIRLHIGTGLPHGAYGFPLAIEYRNLAKLRRRYGHHNLLSIAADSRRPRSNAGEDFFRRSEQQLRFSELECRLGADLDRHDSSIGGQVIKFFTILSPRRRPLPTLIRNLPRACRRRGLCTFQVYGTDIDFKSSRFVRCVGHKAVIRRKARALQLRLAAEDLDWFAFAGDLPDRTSPVIAARRFGL